MTDRELMLTETASDDAGQYTVEWYCTPPTQDEGFYVIADEWSGDYQVRRIFAWVGGQS